MKKIFIFLALVTVVLFSAIASSQIIKERRPDGVTVYKNLDLKQRIEALENKAAELERRLKEMVQITIPTDLGMYVDENDPTIIGDIKVVSPAVIELNDCDSDTGWSVVSGAGVTIELDTTKIKEGIGSLRIYVPANINGIVKYTKPSGSWDISAKKYIRMWTYLETIGGGFENATCYAYFGEIVYDEQGPTQMIATNMWYQTSWNISGIAVGSKDAVTLLGIRLDNTGRTYGKYLYVDYIIASPGISQVKAFDGDKIINLYPKVYVGTYTGDGQSSRTIPFPRKGTPSRIEVLRNGGTDLFLWINGMTASYCHEIGSTNAWITTGINAIGDGSFGIGSTINTTDQIYVYSILFED